MHGQKNIKFLWNVYIRIYLKECQKVQKSSVETTITVFLSYKLIYTKLSSPNEFAFQNDLPFPPHVYIQRYDMIYLLTAIGLTPGGSSTVHIYTQTVNRTTQNKQYIEEHNNLWE